MAGFPIFALVLFGQVNSAAIALQSSELQESSGVCVSWDEALVWSHNDSGDNPRIFGFDRQGRLITTLSIDNAQAQDWEDICSFSIQGKNYLAIGDTGDNQRHRPDVKIYIVEQPTMQAANSNPKLHASIVGCLTVRYPEGASDCEALAYDPLKQVFVLATKELLRCRLFTVDAKQFLGKRSLEAKWLQTIVLPSVTGADISRDGQRMVFATYGPSCIIERSGTDWHTNSKNAMKVFEVPSRRQGESICFDERGKRLLLTSEFAPSPLISILCPAP